MKNIAECVQNSVRSMVLGGMRLPRAVTHGKIRKVLGGKTGGGKACPLQKSRVLRSQLKKHGHFTAWRQTSSSSTALLLGCPAKVFHILMSIFLNMAEGEKHPEPCKHSWSLLVSENMFLSLGCPHCWFQDHTVSGKDQNFEDW